MQRWIKAQCFEAIVHDLRELLRVAQGRNAFPTAAIIDSRTMPAQLLVPAFHPGKWASRGF